MSYDFIDDEENNEIKTSDSVSFAKQLFFGKLDLSKIIPYPRPPFEEKERIDLFCHKLRQFSETTIDPIAIDSQSKIPDEVIHGLAKLGMLGLTVPQQYGGLGMSLTAFCKAIEVISQRCGSTSAFLSAHQSIGYKAILLFGTPVQKHKWLSLIAKGEVIAAFALTEPNAGSDANGVETKAIYDHEKNVFYLSGKKQWITNGSIAQVITVMAKTELDALQGKKESITAFIVTPDMPGFKVTEHDLDKVGMRGIQSSTLEFDNMEVPAENMLGKIGEGLKIALTVLDYGRVSVGAACAGPAKILVDDAFKYARDRHQFQKSLSSFSIVKSKLATLAALAYAIDAVTYLTSGKVDAGQKDFRLEAAMVKVFSTEALWHMIFETMQIFGGKGMFTDKPYELMMRDCRPRMIVEGSNDIMRVFISATAIKEVALQFNEFLEALKTPFNSRTFIQEMFKRIRDLFWPSKIELSSSLLDKEIRMLAIETRKLGKRVLQLLWRYGDIAVEKQLIMEHLSMTAIYLYTTSAVISKLDSDLERVYGKSELLGSDVETGKFFCRLAIKNARYHLANLFDSTDKAAENLSDHILADL